MYSKSICIPKLHITNTVSKEYLTYFGMHKNIFDFECIRFVFVNNNNNNIYCNFGT